MFFSLSELGTVRKVHSILIQSLMLEDLLARRCLRMLLNRISIIGENPLKRLMPANYSPATYAGLSKRWVKLVKLLLR